MELFKIGGMSMNTHESYVSLETAKLLKEAGFDWECSSLYTIDGKFKHLLYDTIDWDYGEVDWNNVTCQKTSYMGIKGWEGGYSAPTIEVAQKWLREARGYDVFVVPCNGLYFYTVRKYYHEDKVDYFDYPNKDAFDTYEKTLETGIQKCLTILLED